MPETVQSVPRRLLHASAACLLAASWWWSAGLAQASGPRVEAASVASSTGDTRLMRPSALLTPLRPGEPIRTGDRVLTGADGRVELRFGDGALVVVQPKSDFLVEEFRYDQQEERSFFRLAKGAVRTVTGAIGKRRQEDFRLSTPTATIGIRGTDFETAENPCGATVCEPGERPGLVVTVYQGRVAVSNAAGTTEVPAGATLYVRNRETPASFGNGEPPARRAPARPEAPPEAPRRNGNGNGARGGGISPPDDPLIERAPALY